MSLRLASDQWRATIAGSDLSMDFWMPAGSTVGEACMQIWTIWSHARANGCNDSAAPVASQFLRLEKIGEAFAVLGEAA